MVKIKNVRVRPDLNSAALIRVLLIRVLMIAVFAFGSVLAINAQGNLGELIGTVTDSNGGVIPNATVTIKNESTGIARTATTNSSGNYRFPNLVVGVYSVTVRADGFGDQTTKGQKVSVAAASRFDAILKPASVAGEVDVTAGDSALTINTDDQQLSTLLDNEEILQLPLLSRNPNALLLIAPGATASNGGQGGISINGQRERNNNFLVDGVDNNDAAVPGNVGGQATPSIDATEEFRVITNSGNAEFGRNSGGIVTVATKSGGNEFHGGAYIFYRSDAF